MNSLKDAIYNWLSIKVVSEKQPEDSAAKETADWFREILTEDYHVSAIDYEKDDKNYVVTYVINGEKETKSYAIPHVEVILFQMECTPEYFKLQS